jgi:hypothetical protein
LQASRKKRFCFCVSDSKFSLMLLVCFVVLSCKIGGLLRVGCSGLLVLGDRR